jgi:S1-C subfamily serine protease
VASVIPGSVGEKAGLLAGDVINSVDGTPVKKLADYSDALKKFQPGDTIKLGILREGKAKVISITLGER